MQAGEKDREQRQREQIDRAESAPVCPIDVDCPRDQKCHDDPRRHDDHFVDDATFAAGLEAFGEQGLVDLIGSLGNFSMLAMLLNTFQVELKPGATPPYPDVRGFQRVDPAASA